MSRLRIEYGGEAVGAKKDFVPSISEKTNFSNNETILQDDSAIYPKFSNPCELYFTALDGRSQPMPIDKTANYGVWSEQVSDEYGDFSAPIVLTMSANELYSSSGITIEFDVANNIFAKSFNIQWYRGLELLSSMDFSPDQAKYYCANKVEFYNKVTITFYGTNMPRNRLKLHSVVYGVKTTFSGDAVKSVNIIHQINPISAEIYVDTCDLLLNLNDGVKYSFERNQYLKIWFDDELMTTQFIETARRNSKTVWNISAEDYVGILEKTIYVGGIYHDTNAVQLLTDIFNVAKVPFEIDDTFLEMVVTGYIPHTNCREALMQVAFAIGAVVDTSYSDVVSVKMLDTSDVQIVPLSRIALGQNISEESRVTAVEVTAHLYDTISEEVTLYESKENGSGNGLYLKFSEPYHDLSIVNGEIIASGVNFAIINALNGCVMVGQKYRHDKLRKRKENPFVLSSDYENIVSIENATLISPNTLDKTLEMCYNYYTNTKTMRAKMIEGRHDSNNRSEKDKALKVGDTVECETSYGNTYKGVITKQSYSLNGNIIAKDTEVK